jgi:hypothetical protein
MELSFNVAWGPISQIALPLVDVAGAVQLAVGAYGWWKARERSLSLTEMIRAVGGRLAPSISFNVSNYLLERNSTGEVRGITWHDGRLESFPLPNASTGASGQSGLDCFRALTTALLALYSSETTSAILVDIIPKRLINFKLDGEHPALGEGPFRACVRQYVATVATEERSDALVKKLWTRIDEETNAMFSLSDGRARVKDAGEVEVPIIILGLLDWILTSVSQRLVMSEI